jgi:hypothetical protein
MFRHIFAFWRFEFRAGAAATAAAAIHRNAERVRWAEEDHK